MSTAEAGNTEAEAPKEDCGVKGQEYLTPYLDRSKSECLNESDEHPYGHCLSSGGGFLESDCDEQLIFSMTFQQTVKVHSLKVRAPKDKGPKLIRIFHNQPNTLDFDKADSMNSTQDLVLTPDQLDGAPIPLRYVKFQNVQNLQFFFKSNQEDADTTQIDYLAVIGSLIHTTKMSEFKRVAGKKGETE